MSEEMDLQEQFRVRLERCQTRLRDLKTRAGRITASTASEFDRQMTDLRAEVEAARRMVKARVSRWSSRLRRAPVAEDEAWKDLEAGYDGTYRELRRAFETATTLFQ